MPDNVDKLFEIMQAKGAASDRDKFRKVFLTPGNKGYKIRKDIYDGLRADGIIDSPTYEDFRRKLRLGGTPTVNKYRQQMFSSVDPNKSRASELTHRAVGQAVRATNNVRKPVTAKVVNQKGKPTGKEFAITPAKTVEDLDREYAQEATKNWENELHDQMADADKDAAKISDMFKSFISSTDEVGSVWGNMTRGGGIAGTPHSVTTNNGILENTEARQILAAGDYNRKRRELLQLEKDSRNGAIFDNHSFFRGMYDAAKDTGFLTGGASDLINAGSLLATKQDLDNGVHTEAGDMLMQQAVKNSDAQSQYGDNQGWMYTGGVITTNMTPFMMQVASAGFSKGMSNAIGKVVQGAASKVALGTMKKATGMAGAHIANYIGKVTGLTTKAFGKAIQYGIVGAAQANTVGLGNVANDVINRYTGQVYQDEQGNYKFGTFDSDGKLVHEGGEDFLTALVKGEAAQTIEFATELAGGGIDAAGTALKNFVTKGGKKIINKYNMENVSKVIDFLLNNKVSKNARYLKAGADRTLGKVELNSIVGESLEEELGIIANTVFTGDNKISDLWDEKQQSQIWGGMLLSIGLMKGAVAPFHAYNAKQYYSYKHKLDKADVNLSQLLGKEKWEELRNQIDATTNDDMPEMVNKINRDVALGKNRQPVREYIQNLLIMRGYDIGNMLAAKKAVEDKGEGVSVKNMEKNQAYQQGRDAYGYDTHEIQLDQEDKQKSLSQLLGISEQQLASMSDEELEALSGRDDNIDRAIYDYQLSTARYEGVIDNARDQIDLEVQRAAQAVDMYTDKSRNTIRNATIKATGGLEDYGVYIINGNIATHEDGSIDISNSDDMILYYDPTTNTVEHADAMMFAELGSEENADEVRNQAMADAKEKAIKETTGIIDGVVEVGTQFKTVDADGTEHAYEVLADNGDGTAVITIDGNIPTELVKGENVQVPVSFEELQKMKDASDQQRLQAAKAQREQMEKERAEQQMQAQTTQAKNPSQEDNIQPAPIEDNLDYSDIIREDGKVQMVDVSDKDGNNLFPDAKDVFYIQGNKMRTKFAYIDANGELKIQSFPTGLVKIKTRGEVSVDDYKKYRATILSAESSAMPESSMIEDNSGTIEANRGGIDVEDNTQPLSEADADNLIAQMESSAEAAPDLELTPDNWTAEFGEDGILSTPIGDVKMGENQVAKLFEKGRSKEFGMIKPTLTNPDVIIEVPSHSADGDEERSSSYLFIKTFLGKNGKKVYYFKSVTIKKDGLEISISSHYDRAKRVKEALMKGKLLYRKNDGAQTEQNQPSASVTTSQEDAAGSSESKDTNISSNGNENNESLTFEDGTPIPVDVNGEVDLSQTDASHAAEWYDNNLGEDADDWLDGEIKKAKKVLEQAKNKKLAGTKPSELVASKKEKEAAIADAQAHYDSAISIRDSLKERRIAKEENTADGRRNLIEKARRKFARLKSAVKDDAEAVSQLYRETIGSLLHRLYDSTGIDVTDTTPLTAEEYVASNLGAHSLNYEGTETSKGVKQETGLSREDFAKTQLLAADGKGTTIDALVHSLWENRPSNLESLDTQDIRNALIGVLNSGFKASEARNFVENIRIAQAENILEEKKRAQENAAYAEQQKAEQKAKSDEKAELKAKSEAKLDNESDNKSNDLSNDLDNEKINDNINDNINVPEVPEDATDEKPLGEQISKDKVPFEIKGEKSGETYDINDKEDRKRLVAENSVDDKDILDIDMPKHVHKAIKELCKKMGLKVQFLYMGARLNGWVENGTMYLALDANKAIQCVFGHEMTHAIKQKNPEAYKELVKVAMAVTTKKKFEEDLAKIYRIYHNASGYNNIDDFVEEVIADNLGKFINDFDLAQKFSLRLNHPILGTILHAIQKIKSLLYGDFYKSVDALERIVEKAYVDTAKGEITNSETGEDVSFSLRQKPEPKKKGIGYKVFVLKDGKLYPPMVANPDGAATPVGVWLDADAAPIAGESKTGRPQVKQGGKGTQGGSGKLAYRPGWHLGVVPYAIQFNRKDAEGNKTLFPKNFVFAEVEYAADVDYQEEARQEGINPSGKYQHSLAGLRHLPTDGYYMYRTNPNPETDPWVITGAMKVNRILTRAEQAELVKNAGREPQQIQEGDIVTDDVVNRINQEIADAPKFSLKDNQENPLNQDGTLKLDKIKSVDELTDEDFTSAFRNVELPAIPKNVDAAIGANGKPIVIKKNIFEKNWNAHKFTPAESKKVLNDALYNTDLVGHTQPTKKPNHWVAIKLDDKSPITVLEVNDNKNNVEVVGWYTLDERNLGRIKRQAERNGGELIMLTPKDDKVESLSTPPLSSAAKIDNSSETTKGNGEKFSLKDEKTMFGMHNISVDKLRKAIKQGGFAAPSMGVVDSKNGIYSDYGEITLIPKAEKLAKRTGKNAGTFTADAWTPTYPQVERIMNKQGEKSFNTDMNVKLGDVDNGIYSNVRESWKGYLSSGDVRDGLYWHYLFDNGMNPETIYQTGKYDNDITNEVMRISDNGNKTDYTDKEVAELIQLMNKATGKDNDVDAQREKLKARIASAEKQGNHLLVALKKKRLEELEGVENFYIAADFVNDVVRNNRKNGKVDVHDTMGTAKKKVEDNKKLSDDFPSWLDKKTEEYGVEEMLYNGTTPSGKPKYIPNTIENAVKLMKKQGVAGGYTAFGSELGVFIAKNSPEVNTLAAMKNAKDKLIPFGDERHNQIKDKITKEFLELSDEIRVGSNNRYAFDDSGVSRMVELTDNKGNEKEYLKKAYNIEVSDEWMDRYNKLLDTIKKDYKVFYFETKFMRPYGLDEFEKAIVPSDTPSDVIDALKKAGIDVSSYERGNAEDRQKVTMDAINSSDNIRFSLAGERGAAAADKAEERTFRMDNLSVARKMEEKKKDAKAIKMATGWERGADGKWRYEMPDAKIKDTMDVGGGHIVKRYEDDMLWNGGKLFDVIDAPELFKAYPQLKGVRIDTDAIMNDMPSHGKYDSKTNTITIHADELKYMNDILNHEIQHAIQSIEGFATGGSPTTIRGEVKKRFNEVTKQIKQLRAEGKEDEAKALIEKNRGLYDAYMKNDDFNSYKSLAGEVEARNVQERLNMTPEERRKTLAESTEDVARKDQIFLGVGDVSFSLRDMADGKESGAADMAEDLKSLNTPDEVDDAIKTAIEDMPSGWKMANKKMIHIAQALGENRKAEIAGEEPKFSLKDGTLIKAGTYFSGGGLVEEGLKGIIDPVVAVEYDEKISGVYRNNFGQHIVTADVRDVDPRELVKQIDGEVEYFHASPVCKNYSQAKSNHAEVELDKETAASTAEFINAIKPKVVTIENVKGYKDSDAMNTITDALDANGYTWDADVYNAADYGGYTNRERLIVRAVRDGKLPAKPEKMARKSGWYEAVADIIPTLTEKKNGVAPWMDIRLKADGIDWRNIDKPLYVMGSAYADGKVPHAFADELLPTLRTKSGDVIVMPDGKVYRAMGRVLARVSGVSDDYKMPFSENLSHTIIGNGIPTQLTEHVIAPLLTGSDPKFSIRTYHGTGASFDKFDLSHAFEGEGSETFGHGVYVTNSKKIGDNYAQRAKDRKGKFGFDYKIDMSAEAGEMLSHYINKNQDVDKGLENARQDLKSALEMFPDDETLKELSAILQKNNNEIAESSNEAYRYDVDIPDDNGENYLGWNESQNFPLEKWYRLWEITHHGFSDNEYFKDGGARYDKDRIERIIQMKLDSPENGMQKLPTLKGEELYHALEDFFDRERPLRGAKLASRALSEIGFVGIKYPAGMIHGGAEEADYNYVIFDENNANIVGNTRFSLRGSTPYGKQMEEWMEKNHLEKGAVPMEKPIMKEGENIFDYANRMVEWTRNQNLWKTAPKQTGFQDALDKWKADNGLSPDAYPPVRPHRENYSTEIGYAEDLEEYNKKKELWKSAPKPKDFDLSVDLEDMNKQLRNIRRAVLNQKNYDQRTVKAVSDLVRKMLNIGWGDGLSRGKVGNLLSAAKNATGANDVKKYLDNAMGILAENYLNRLSTAYDNLINTKGARADQSGVIKMGSLDAKGQAFMSEYKKAINMDDKSLNSYIANIEEDSAKNEDNVEMNDYRLAGIQASIMYKQQIGGNDADIAELKRQIGELKNKKAATKEDKDLLKSLEKKLFENKFDRITMYENLLNNIQRMVKESKGRAKEFREEITEHKNEILHRANLDLEGVDSTYYDTTTAKKKLVNNDLQRAVFSSTYTFEQFLKFFGKKAANGEGYLYNYFSKLNQDALDEEQLYNEMNRNALDEKTKELFGKEKFMKLVGIDGKGMKEMDIEVTDYSNKETGKRTIHLKQGQMLYIYLVNKETDGEMKLRAMGITEEDVAAIEENLDPRVKAMGEWLQDEYLPECQRRYQATHTKYFGAPMKEVENYFPLAINNRARNVKEDVNQDSDAMSQLAGTSTGAIVTRRVNVIPLDIENADAFEVAFNHLQEMEEWSAMLPFRQDINTLLSYTHFRNQVQNMSSVAYGSGKTLWDEFKQTAQIAAGTYKPKVNAGMMDSRIAAAMGGIAVAKISGRLWTAIKQSQSATVFLPECDFTRFVKNGVNPYGSWKWAKENIPDFRKRIENITYGDVKLRQYLDELEKYHDWTKVISKWGMAPNVLVDGITCAVGARSVYETEVNRLTKLGYPKEKAEEKAYYKAVAAYNKTQQSSGGMYLSPMQVDRTYASAALSLFKNANYAYGRMQIEACRGLARTYDFWGGKHKTTLIESMTRQIMEEDGLDENTARAIAKATYNRTFRQSIGRLINFATLVPVSWALYKVLPYLLTGDDDDKKKDMIEEAVLKGFATSLSDNYVIPFASNILNTGLKVEDGKPTFDQEVFKWQNLYINPATSDLANIYSMIGNQKWYSVCNKVGMLGVQMLIGFNPETVGALYQALSEADYDNGNTAKEWQMGILKAISAPEESIRELYMDELGLKSGDKDAMKKFMSLAGLDADDINKVPLAELEKRYAERQINRDNLLSQVFMDAETFNGYVDKYQKSFEKKIKDKMDKWDEYDKKKADEFFDTTSDPKLKDMIEKKRTKDANFAADEQIAKEGLNQEKKGKEPSEEAYDAVKMSIDVAEDNAISTYNKVLNKRYAALNDEYNNQTDAMKYIFMSKHPNFKSYKDLESEYTTYGKKMKELKEKLVSADGYDAKQTILKQIRVEREKFSELQSKVR